MDEISIGSCLGNYKIIKELGRGGMGVVYLGKDQELGRFVAIKILHCNFETLIKRFELEGKAVASLDNSRIVRIFHKDKVKLANGNEKPYIIMEYVEGAPLSSYISIDVLPDEKTMRWRLDKFQEILEAIQYAHENGVIHRDLKPKNIMISNSDQVKILDFGLALVNGEHIITENDDHTCSLSYASPEQVNGLKNTDKRSDIYSLGVVLYQLLTGSFPFEGTREQVVFKIFNEPAPSVQALNSGISDELSAVVARCLEKEPDKRFQSVQELLDEFKVCPERQVDAISAGKGIVVKPVPGDDGTYCTTSVGGSTSERILVEARRIIEEAFEHPDGDVIEAYVDKQVSDRFQFGHYPQGPNGEVEPITWRVLKRDSDGLLVIAEQGLDCKRYNEEYGKVTWADCTLRRWLNDEFFNEAFSSEEQSLIKTVDISNNAGPSTDDRIFLLSIDEAKSLFANDKDRAINPTIYALKNGVYASTSDNWWKWNTWWWLRSRGGNGYRAANVGCDGDVCYGYYVCNFGGCVRPACLLAI